MFDYSLAAESCCSISFISTACCLAVVSSSNLSLAIVLALPVYLGWLLLTLEQYIGLFVEAVLSAACCAPVGHGLLILFERFHYLLS